MSPKRVPSSGGKGKTGSPFTDRETIRVYSGDSVSSSKSKNSGKRKSTLRATIKRITDNVGKYKGKLANGARTDDRKPKLTGTLSSRLKDGQKLRIYASRKSNGKAKLLGIAKVKGKKWSFTPAKKLASNRRYIFKAQVTDAKGKKLGRASKTRTLILDSKKPTLTITDNITGIAKDAVTFTFTFSEKVKGFKKSDIRISGGTAGTFTKVNGRVYTLLVSPTDNAVGSIVAAVGKKKARDRAGNGNKAQSSTQAFDTKAPSLTITDNTSGSARSEVLFTFTFSEAVSGFSSADINISGGSKGIFKKISDSVYTLLVSTTESTRGTVTVDVAAKVASDAAGNNNTAAVQASQVFDSRTSIELSDVAEGKGGFVIYGENEHDRSGYSVSYAGDVNGDGIDDLIIGAPYADPNGKGSGSSYVVFGKKDKVDFINLYDINFVSGGFAIHGENGEPEIDGHTSGPGDYSGYPVSSAGDVNGDGFSDLIISAVGANNYTGSTYVVFGKTSEKSVQLSNIAAGDGGFVINGVAEEDYSGSSVSSAGDFNGDGFDDLLIGAPNADSNGNNSGSTYVVFGKEKIIDPIELSDITESKAGFVIIGEAENDYSGQSIYSAGDVNGDGFDDLLIGAPNADSNGNNSGSTYVVFGKDVNSSPVQLSDIASGKGGFVIEGEAQNDYSGYSVSAAGDVNGDGLDDLIIGAPFDRNYSGSTYVVFGKKGNTDKVKLSDIADKKGGGFLIKGESAEDESGYSVSSAGDINRDGFADLIIGAQYANRMEEGLGADSKGKVYVVFEKQCRSC